MKELRGRTAVVTGAASGIGRGLARRAADEGMRVVLADVDEGGLGETLGLVRERGAEAVAVPTDVSKAEQVEALASEALAAFDAVHLVFNNAGVLLPGCAWERSAQDWEWVLGVNLFGVVHGSRVFMPLLVESGRALGDGGPTHMVNTASVGGLIVGPFLAPYIVSKHAVVALTESIHYELAARGEPVRVSALCPGAVATGITSSERIRPSEMGAASPLGSDAERTFAQGLVAGIGGGIAPDELGDHVFAAVREERFWILPDPLYEEPLRARTKSMLEGSDPVHPLTLQLPD